MAAIFTPTANLGWKLTLLALAAVFSGPWAGGGCGRAPITCVMSAGRSANRCHSATNTMSRAWDRLSFCHTSVEVSSSAGLPPTYTCMTCHSQIWTNAAHAGAGAREPGERQADRLASGHRSPGLRLFQPQHSHRQGRRLLKLSRGGGSHAAYLQGEDPHHAVLPGCHRNPGPQLRPKDEIYNTEWQRTADTPSPEALLARIPRLRPQLTDCSICHR